MNELSLLSLMQQRYREYRLQFLATEAELQAIDDWRFERRHPSRAEAVRELLRLGLVDEDEQVRRH